MYLGITKILLLFQFLLTRGHTRIETSGTTRAEFEDSRMGKRLLGLSTLINTLKIPSQSGCANACNRNSNCMSFNFCDPKLCDLNSEDIYSTQQGEGLLQNAPGCKYLWFEKHDVPTCRDGNLFANVRNDFTNQGKCRINKVRVDKEWSEWEVFTVADNSTEWRKVERQEILLQSAHGGFEGETASERDFFWIKFVYEQFNWTKAKANCEAIGRRLFDNLDGTKGQLDSLIERLEPERFYFLGFRYEGSDVWVNTLGGSANTSQFYWAKGQPSDQVNQPIMALAADSGMEYLHDVYTHRQLFSICDML